MKKIILNVVFVLSLLAFNVSADELPQQKAFQVDYQGQSPVDLDLDGLTDQGEAQLYYTDQKNSDTDGDGYYDSIEILAESDPLNTDSIPGMPLVQQDEIASSQDEIPWAWYASRSSGLVGFILLYLSIFLGLTMRVPFLRRFFTPLYAMPCHCWISFQATVFALIHGLTLLFDKFFGFTFVDVFVPYASEYERNLVALGIFGFYLMVILVATSYGRKYISNQLWRTVHFSNIVLYLFVVIHAYYLGTDLKNPVVSSIFLWSNAFLILLMLINMQLRISEVRRRRKATALLRQVDSGSGVPN